MKKLLARFRLADRLFLAVVVLPTILAVLYYGLLSSDVYVSESRFIVRSPEKPQMSGVGLLLKGAGFSNAGDEIFAAQSYVNSRDALKVLDTGGAYRKAYTLPSISIFDRYNSFGLSGSFEELYAYYQGKVHTEHDTTSSITTLSVKAYTPEDAQRFNRQLLAMSEALVNRLNDRARSDLIQTSRAEVDAAKVRSEKASLALSRFRNREGVIDPEKQATIQFQMISKLQDEMIATRAQLAQLRSVAPRNPQIIVLEAQARSLKGDIDEELRKVAGGSASLSSVAAEYQRLQLENQFADRQLASAMASLQDAENEARRKQAYVERIAQPSLPDFAIEPRRMRGIISTLLFALIAWGVLSMMLAGVREHQQ
jgi:BexC/CtrB/KpsE family polysaccharide export inner-membrane protein